MITPDSDALMRNPSSLDTLRKLGTDTVPCTFFHPKSEKERKWYALLHNQICYMNNK